MAFVKATKEKAKLRLAIQGPSGSGKTFSALKIATLLDPSKRIAVVDTENRSASKYAHLFDFDVEEVTGTYDPTRTGALIKQAVDGGYGSIVFDSYTLFWNGPGGFLEMVDEEVLRQKRNGNKPDSFGAWKAVDKIYRRVVQDIIAAPIHVILTLRAKTEYEKSDDGGKSKIRKVGLAPQMRDDFQYEMDVEGMLDMEHNLMIGKTRCDTLDRKNYPYPGENFVTPVLAWLTDGAEAKPRAAEQPQPPAQAQRPAVTGPNAAYTTVERMLREAKAPAGVTAARKLWKDTAGSMIGDMAALRRVYEESAARIKKAMATDDGPPKSEPRPTVAATKDAEPTQEEIAEWERQRAASGAP